MKSLFTTSLLGAAALFAAGCGATEGAEAAAAQELAEVGEALAEPLFAQSGSMLFKAFTLYPNCTLTADTAGATPQRDPVLGLIINNGNGSAWGSANVPCNHGTPLATEGYTTLAFGDDFNSNNLNAKISYKNTSGGAPVTVFAVGFIKEQINTASTNYGVLPVNYSISGCTDPSKNTNGNLVINQDFQASGKKASLPGYVYTNQPRPGGPQTQQNTVLYGLDPSPYGGSGKCNDDCASGWASGSNQSCITNNSGSNLWFFSAPWSSVGFTSFNN